MTKGSILITEVRQKNGQAVAYVRLSPPWEDGMREFDASLHPADTPQTYTVWLSIRAKDGWSWQWDKFLTVIVAGTLERVSASKPFGPKAEAALHAAIEPLVPAIVAYASSHPVCAQCLRFPAIERPFCSDDCAADWIKSWYGLFRLVERKWLAPGVSQG